jgi:hypothetical protein
MDKDQILGAKMPKLERSAFSKLFGQQGLDSICQSAVPNFDAEWEYAYIFDFLDTSTD